MKTGPFVVSALLLSAAAFSAQGQYVSSLTPNCNSSPNGCNVVVIVPPSCGNGVRVIPDPIVVRAGDAVRIRWTITGDWDFADSDGVFIYSGGEKVFKEFTRAADNKTFTVDFQKPQRGSFKYDMNFKKGAQTCRIDPIIVNW